MRPVIRALSIIFYVSSTLFAADLTVILDFEAGYSSRSVIEMKAEAEKLLITSGVSVTWRSSNGFVSGESFPQIAVVKFKGQCELTSLTPQAPEAGSPLGFTYSADGRIIPFSEVECDRVRGTLGSAHLATSGQGSDELYGRALGRVLAHELFHVLSGSKAHAKHGVMRKYLSAAELVGNRM